MPVRLCAGVMARCLGKVGVFQLETTLSDLSSNFYPVLTLLQLQLQAVDRSEGDKVYERMTMVVEI